MKIKHILMIFGIFSIFSTTAYSMTYNIAEKGYVIMNLGDDAKFSPMGFNNSADYNQLFMWGKSKGITLVDDKKPVADRRSSFVSASGVKFKITGFKPNIVYNMYLDLVSLKASEMPGISSRLKVYVDDRQVDEIVWGNYDPDKLYKIELPLDLTYKGDAEISLKEYSLNYGYWGMWDIIVTPGEPEEGYIKDTGDTEPLMESPEAKPISKDSAPEKESGKKEPIVKSDDLIKTPASDKEKTTSVKSEPKTAAKTEPKTEKKETDKKPSTLKSASKSISKKKGKSKSSSFKGESTPKTDFETDFSKSYLNKNDLDKLSSDKVFSSEKPVSSPPPANPSIKQPSIPDVVMPEFKK